MSNDIVSLRDIYSAIERLEDKIDKRVTPIERDVDDLKAYQNKAMGTLGVLSAFVSLAASYFWNKITKS